MGYQGSNILKPTQFCNGTNGIGFMWFWKKLEDQGEVFSTFGSKKNGLKPLMGTFWGVSKWEHMKKVK